MLQKIFAHLLYQAHSVKARKITLDLCEPNPKAKLLDCGCWHGETTAQVAARIGAEDIWGIDILEEEVVNAGRRGIKAVKADLNSQLPFPDESFDVVHAANIIEHLGNTDLFLKEIHRVLKGGYLLVSTCNLASLHNVSFLLLGRQPPAADVSDEFQTGVWSTPRAKEGGPSHRRIFTLRALTELLECYGFRVEEKRGAGFYPLPSLLARVACRLDKKHAAYIVVKARKGNGSAPKADDPKFRG